jgi:hypothetical protein
MQIFQAKLIKMAVQIIVGLKQAKIEKVRSLLKKLEE